MSITDWLDGHRCPYCGGLLLDADYTRINWNDEPDQQNLPAHAACAMADEHVEYAQPQGGVAA